MLMVGFKNRYMVMEVFLDPNKGHQGDDPDIIPQLNLSKAIKDSILLNFGECGLASSLGSFQCRCQVIHLSSSFLSLLRLPLLLFICLLFICVFKYVNPITKLCIIRVSREEYQKVWSVVTMVKNIGNCPVLFDLLDLSGNIKASKKAALKCDELKFGQYKLRMGTGLSADVTPHMQNCLEKIKLLEH